MHIFQLHSRKGSNGVIGPLPSLKIIGVDAVRSTTVLYWLSLGIGPVSTTKSTWLYQAAMIDDASRLTYDNILYSSFEEGTLLQSNGLSSSCKIAKQVSSFGMRTPTSRRFQLFLWVLLSTNALGTSGLALNINVYGPGKHSFSNLKTVLPVLLVYLDIEDMSLQRRARGFFTLSACFNLKTRSTPSLLKRSQTKA
mmetsp:Transcript_8049/g.10675  ORF Transcript_8049/g.10675 Transcript_8049/m.10675 type:complete len:196 (-) Transcript_8049:351-938(-)